MTPEDTPPPSPQGLKQTAGEVAVSLAGSLKGQPLAVALLLVNLFFLAAVFVAVREARLQEHAETKLILERCVPVHSG